MEKVDIAIVGAGPAGLQTAISASKDGYPPVVFEEHATIGQPIQCGEGISTNALIDFSLTKEKKEFVVRDLKRCQLVFPGNKVIFGDIHAHMIRRDKFDQLLGERAVKLGTDIRLSTKISSVRRSKEGVILRTSGNEKKEIMCKFLILAEGAIANVAKSLKFNTGNNLIRAYEYKIEGIWGEDLEFYFDSQLYPFGYCWIFPRNNETNVGIVTTAKDRKNRLDSFIKEKKITGKIKRKIGGNIPMHGPVNPLFEDNVLLVGDTGGMVNPIFYGGIRIGMMSGKIAGEVIARKLKSITNGESYGLGNYVTELKKYDFMREINLKCHRFFYNCPNKYLENIGQIFDNLYINQIEKWEVVKIIGRLLKRPSLLKKPQGLHWIYRGFKIARDWGF